MGLTDIHSKETTRCSPHDAFVVTRSLALRSINLTILDAPPVRRVQLSSLTVMSILPRLRHAAYFLHLERGCMHPPSSLAWRYSPWKRSCLLWRRPALVSTSCSPFPPVRYLIGPGMGVPIVLSELGQGDPSSLALSTTESGFDDRSLATLP